MMHWLVPLGTGSIIAWVLPPSIASSVSNNLLATEQTSVLREASQSMAGEPASPKQEKDKGKISNGSNVPAWEEKIRFQEE